jgi:ribosome-binding factor A
VTAAHGKAPSQRQLRVGEAVRHALVALLQRGEIPDPLIERTLVSVTQVEMTPDLRVATVYLQPLGGGDPAPLVAAFEANARLVRGRMSPALRQLRSMPQFRFRADTSFDNYARIDALLHRPEVARDLVARGGTKKPGDPGR